MLLVSEVVAVFDFVDELAGVFTANHPGYAEVHTIKTMETMGGWFTLSDDKMEMALIRK